MASSTMRVLLSALVIGAQLHLASSASSSVTLRVNPIRRVVNMLQSMTKKIDAEGDAEEKLFEKFMCYCKNGKGSLEASIAAAEEKIPQLQSSVKEIGSKVEQLMADVEAAKKGREEAKQALTEGKALREKEAAAFAKESSDDSTNIAAMGKAIIALEKGAGNSFLQTSNAAVLRKLSINLDMSSADRDMLSSFLSTNSDYAPQSGQIVGILKQMQETMQNDLAEITKAEENAIKEFDSMATSKAKEIEAMTMEIEDKTARIGEDGVKLVELKEDLEDTEHALKEDQEFLADLDKNCATKEAEWAVRQKLRAEEILAVHETIKILNDDDSLELFKKTLPSASLLQMQTTMRERSQRAVAALSAHGSHDFRLNLVALALKGRKVSFDKVLGMIDEMSQLLGKEQVADDDKKQFCDEEIDKTEDELKELEHNIEDLGKAIEEHKGEIEATTADIAALEQGVKDLDKNVEDATEQRKAEHAEYETTLGANSAAVELLALAKNRMRKFYDPKLYKAPPKRELTEEERVSVNFGGKMAPTAPPGGIAGTGVTAMAQMNANPGAPPATFGKYEKSGEESNGVLAMIDMLVGDIEQEIQTMEVDEKNAQEEYEELMKVSAEKRTSDVKSIADKSAAKADLEANLQKLEGEDKATKTEAMGKGKELMDLHGQCDWLLQNFDTRKEARAAEVESLANAKAVLSGADYSF